MNQTDFSRELADMTGLTIKDSKAFTEAFIELLYKKIVDHEIVTFMGFGSFNPVYVDERKCFNFGKPTVIPAHYNIKFKPSSKLKAEQR